MKKKTVKTGITAGGPQRHITAAYHSGISQRNTDCNGNRSGKNQSITVTGKTASEAAATPPPPLRYVSQWPNRSQW